MRRRAPVHRRGRARRGPLGEVMLNARTAAFLGRRLWRPAVYAAGDSLARRGRRGRVRRLRLRSG